MHTREERLFFFSSPYCFCEGKLFSEVNLWHLTALSSLWLLAHKAFKESFHFSRLAAMDLTSSRNSYPAFFLSFFFSRAPPGGLWTSSSSVSFWCPSRCFGPVLVYLRSCLIRSFTLFHLFTRKAIDNIDLNQMSHRYVRGVLQNDRNVLVDFRSLDRSQRGRYIWVSLSYTNGQYCHFQFISLKKRLNLWYILNPKDLFQPQSADSAL